MRALATLGVLGILLMAGGCGSSDSGTTTTTREPPGARDAMHVRISRDIQMSHLPPQAKKLLLRLTHKGKMPCTPKQIHRLEQAIRASAPVDEVSVDCAKPMP